MISVSLTIFRLNLKFTLMKSRMSVQATSPPEKEMDPEESTTNVMSNLGQPRSKGALGSKSCCGSEDKCNLLQS